ncbi:hypothetical protein CsSME_00052977 [Camellia sinensis var. sinensis]
MQCRSRGYYILEVMDADTNIASMLRHRSSPTIELLTCLAWALLLRRVGDGIMVYLLKYTSIFLPLPRKQHYQVAGFPISDFWFKSKHISKPNYQHSSLVLGKEELDLIHFLKISDYMLSSSYFILIIFSYTSEKMGCNLQFNFFF